MIECVCCHDTAVIRDYRRHGGCVSSYVVCSKHQMMDDRNFWKAFHKKAKEG